MTFKEELIALMKKHGVKEVHVKPQEEYDIQIVSQSPVQKEVPVASVTTTSSDNVFTQAGNAAEATIDMLKKRAGIITSES